MTGLSHATLEGFIQLRVIKCTTVAASTILIWDYFITLQHEVALIWTSRWSASKCLFMMNRYFIFTELLMFIYVLMFATKAHVCESIFRTLGYLATIGFVVSQLILLLRTFAVWGRNSSKVFACLLTAYLFMIAIVFWDIHRYLAGVKSLGVPAPGLTGCTLFFGTRLVWVSIVLFMTTETVLVALLTYKAVQHFRTGDSSLLMIIYHDGLLYFACILASSIGSLIVALVAPIAVHLLLLGVQRVFHSVLCNHILLRIRMAHQVQVGDFRDSIHMMDITPTRRTLYSDADSVSTRFHQLELKTPEVVRTKVRVVTETRID
ncbi:hypothetical protein BD410DRAFT_634457 [Rickenella mellea]|uniref:DUF6533 domain-containing protein n=1 Tax=Rickenella mellea TaxID=50990 RepID=A0A4Y7QDJ2_9AGAM|nr:hypothetical protein BD410DRAFT_634457 [Rickenella mellea]